MADIDIMENWQEEPEEPGFIGEALASLFEAHPEHASQYNDDRHFDSMLWVCQRWLEVLPLANNQRQWFIAQHNLDDAKRFIKLLLKEENPS